MGRKQEKTKKEQLELPLDAKMRTIRTRMVLFIFAISFLLYGNTIWNGYSMDDELVVDNQQNVAKGLAGIPEIFMSRYAVNESQSYEYRPIVLVSFALETQIANKPGFHHFMNIIYYALTGVVLFFLLLRLFKNQHWLLPALATVLFLIHPIHSEVVASLKNRDEILSLLFSLLAIRYFFLFGSKEKWKYFAFGVLLMALSVLSKKSSLTMIAIIPLTMYFFSEISVRRLALIFAGPVLGFLVFKVTQLGFVGQTEAARFSQYFENPAYVEHYSLIEKLGFGFHTTGFYLLKLILPFPLVVYYGYNSVSLGSWSDPLTIISALIVTGILIYALRRITKKEIHVFGILFFFIAISMFSNVFVPAVGIVAERFAFGASVGFSIVVAWFILKLFGEKTEIESVRIPAKLKWGVVLLVVVCSGYVINRNNDWKSRFSIYVADIDKVPQSAKLHALMGSEYANVLEAGRTGKKKLSMQATQQKIDSAVFHFTRATEIYSGYKTMHNNLGTIYFNYLKNYDSARACFNRAINLDPSYAQAYFNMSSVCEADAGKFTLMEQVFRKGIPINNDTLSAERVDSLALVNLFTPLKNLEADLTAFVNAVVKSSSIEDANSKRSKLSYQVDVSLNEYFPADNLRPDRERLISEMNNSLDLYINGLLQVKPEQITRGVLATVCGNDYSQKSFEISGLKDSSQISSLLSFARNAKIDSYKKTIYYLNKTLEHKSNFLIAFDKLHKLYESQKIADSLIALNTRFLDNPDFQKSELMISIGNGYILKNKLQEGVDWYIKATQLDLVILESLSKMYNQMAVAKMNIVAGKVYEWYVQKRKRVSFIYATIGSKLNELGQFALAQEYLLESEKYKMK